MTHILSKLTNTPATIEAMAFLRSLQSIHSHSGHRKLSRNPAISSKIRLPFLFCTYTWILPLTTVSWIPETQPKIHLVQSSKNLRCSTTITSNLSHVWCFGLAVVVCFLLCFWTELGIPYTLWILYWATFKPPTFQTELQNKIITWTQNLCTTYKLLYLKQKRN